MTEVVYVAVVAVALRIGDNGDIDLKELGRRFPLP